MIRFFPFEITYRKKLKNEFNEFSNQYILDFFIKDFRDSGVKNIRTESENRVIADIMFFAIRPGWNWNRWVGIGQSSVQIEGTDQESKRIVIYRFNLTRLFTIAFIASIFFWAISQEWWTGLFAFGVLGFLNWIIKLIQHSSTFYGTFSDMKYERKKSNKT
jgi:hypothetical protein